MKRVLFVGENPLGTGGCANMLAAMLSDLNLDEYQVACFAVRNINPAGITFDPLPYTLIQGSSMEDYWGNKRLVSLIREVDFELLCMVGIDFWRYLPAWNAIKQLRKTKKFKWVGIFPYDLWHLRQKWVDYLKDLDHPFIYSRYGYDLLKPHIPHLGYFRPQLNEWESFRPLSRDQRSEVRKRLFPYISADTTLFGFVGGNQIRKSPERLVKAFYEAKKVTPDIALYLHTELHGSYNLGQIAEDNGAGDSGDLMSKREGTTLARKDMPEIYNVIDCLVNCSMQEGLSFTPLEAMLCGTPVIASDTTAQTELVKGAGELVPCKDVSFIPMSEKNITVNIESRECRVEDIRDAIIKVAKDAELRKSMAGKGIEVANKWLNGVSDINITLAEAGKKQPPKRKIDAVLFAQHSSAGDVLMTTQCFKGIKERHPGMPLVYMTQKSFAGIVEGNPYVDEIIEWDERLLSVYEVVYNPHGEKILHGGWNNLDVTLYSMYPYFCNLDPDENRIKEKVPGLSLFGDSMWDVRDKSGIGVIGYDDYIVVHTTGGDKDYRSYAHLNLVIKKIDLPVVQLGGATDLRCDGVIDLCGKLSWRESAWVMKHAKAAVVVDSFMSHLAGAVGTNAVVLYGPAPARVVKPRMQHGAKLINLEPDMLKVCGVLSHCWGTTPPGRVKCNSPCINTISPIKVQKALEGFL